MPRQSKATPEEIASVVKKYEDVIFKDSTTTVMSVGPTHSIWDTISSELDDKVTNKSVYVRLKCNRNDILNLLNRKIVHSSIEDASQSHSDGSGYGEYDEDEDGQEISNVERKKFHIDIFLSEFKSNFDIQSVVYGRGPKGGSRSYLILKPGSWTSVIHEHFWNETKLPCALAFKRAKVYESGSNYCVIRGYCKDCTSQFAAVLHKAPMEDDDMVTFECSYAGPFAHCRPTKKRRMTKEQKDHFASEQIEKKKSTVSIRNDLANEFMDESSSEPPHLFSGNALRVAKCRGLKRGREDVGINDPILAACKMKYLHPYLNTICDIGYDRFFIHYWTVSEVNVYNEYAKKRLCPTISIDATGGLLKEPNLISGRKTNKILLYEIAFNDKGTGIQLSVGHMLSERHDNNSINHWLTEWLRNGAHCPRQVVTDMSLALLSGVVKAFTPHTTLWKYIQFCYDVLRDEDYEVSEKNMPCLIRCDVAHVIKLTTTWTPFKTVDHRVKKFFVRVIGQILLSEDMKDVEKLLKNLFWVVYAKEVGNEGTCSEQGRQYLRRRIAVGNEVLDPLEDIEGHHTDQYDHLFSDEADVDHIPTDVGHVGGVRINLTERRKSNPFYMMSYDIAVKCHADVQNEDGIENLHHLPTIVPYMLNLLAYLPLWSGIMCKRIGFGDNPPSSASVESQFNNLKNRVLKHRTLPMRVDDFLKIHILSLSGSVKLGHSQWMKSTTQPQSQISPPEDDDSVRSALISNPRENIDDGLGATTVTTELVPDCVETRNSQIPDEVAPNDVEGDQGRSIILRTPQSTLCICCAEGNLPTGAHKCILCKKAVHLLENCSLSIGDDEGYGEKRVCMSCHELNADQNQVFEAAAVESWKKKATRKRKSVYLTPRKELLFQSIDSRAKTKIIGILQNGTKLGHEPVTVSGKKFILSNTCAFDSIIQILAVAYCDSNAYCSFVQKHEKETIWALIMSLLRNGVTTQAYIKRAKILSEVHESSLNTEANDLGFNITKLSVEQPADTLLQRLLHKFPSVIFNVKCMTCKCTKITKQVLFQVIIDQIEMNEQYLINKFYESVANFKSSGKHQRKGPTTRRQTQKTQCATEENFEIGPHLLFNILNLHPNVTNIGINSRIQLSNIPKELLIEQKQFHFRGVITTTAGEHEMPMSAIGHYKAACYREPLQIFQLYDDLLKNVKNLRDSEIVNTQLFIYSL